MAQQFIFECDECEFSIEEWDDGNPYEIMLDGSRNYVYHPDDLSNTVGNALNYICRECGKTSCLDPDKDEIKCKFCNSINIEDILKLNNKKCIKCDGKLTMRPTGSIS